MDSLTSKYYIYSKYKTSNGVLKLLLIRRQVNRFEHIFHLKSNTVCIGQNADWRLNDLVDLKFPHTMLNSSSDSH